MPTRYASKAVSVWTLGASALIADLHDADVNLTSKTEDVSGVGDAWQFAFSTKYDAVINANMYATDDTIDLALGTAVTVVYNTGPVTYSGTFLIADVHHTAPRDGVQMLKITLKTQGQLGV